MEGLRFDGTQDACLFHSFLLCGLTVGQVTLGRAFRKGPLAAATVANQEEFDLLSAPTVTHRRHLQR